MKNIPLPQIAATFLIAFGSNAWSQAARPVTDLQINRVRSENSPWENIPASAFSSSWTTHGGRWFEVQFAVTGYDNGRPAVTFSGSTSRVSKISETPILDSSRRKVGATYVYRVTSTTSQASGTWQVTAYTLSNVFPNTTKSDRLLVR